MNITEDDKFRCEKCNSTFGYVRIKDNSFHCRACGHDTDIPKELEQNGS